MTEESVPVTLVHEKGKIKLIDTPGTGNADNYKELELGRLDSLEDERHLLKQFKDGFKEAGFTIDAVLFCIKLGQRFSHDTAETIRMLNRFEIDLKHVILVLTNASCTSEEDEAKLKNKLISRIQTDVNFPKVFKIWIQPEVNAPRYILVDSKCQDDNFHKRKVNELLAIVKEMKQAGHSPYEDKEFKRREAEYRKKVEELEKREKQIQKLLAEKVKELQAEKEQLQTEKAILQIETEDLKTDKAILQIENKDLKTDFKQLEANRDSERYEKVKHREGAIQLKDENTALEKKVEETSTRVRTLTVVSTSAVGITGGAAISAGLVAGAVIVAPLAIPLSIGAGTGLAVGTVTGFLVNYFRGDTKMKKD